MFTILGDTPAQSDRKTAATACHRLRRECWARARVLIWDNEILRTLEGIYSAREAAIPCHTATAAVSCVK